MSTTNGTGGNIRYMAPERIDPTTQALRRKPAVDVYAFACVCYLVSPFNYAIDRYMTLVPGQLYTGRHPFYEHPAAYTVLLEVMAGRRPTRMPLNDCCTPISDPVWSTIEDCWARTPESRPTMEIIRNQFRQLATPGLSAHLQPADAERRRSYKQLARLSIPAGGAPAVRPLPTPPLSASPTVHALLNPTPVRPNVIPTPTSAALASPRRLPDLPIASSSQVSLASVLTETSAATSHSRQWSLYDTMMVHGRTRAVQQVPGPLHLSSFLPAAGPSSEHQLPASKVCLSRNLTLRRI
jgi:hypothetical protein